MKTDCLYFAAKETAEYFASLVIAAGHYATVGFDDDFEHSDDYRYSVTYSGPEVTHFSQSAYSAVGRRASRFAR
jgi:hypothetical protein